MVSPPARFSPSPASPHCAAQPASGSDQSTPRPIRTRRLALGDPAEGEGRPKPFGRRKSRRRRRGAVRSRKPGAGALRRSRRRRYGIAPRRGAAPVRCRGGGARSAFRASWNRAAPGTPRRASPAPSVDGAALHAPFPSRSPLNSRARNENDDPDAAARHPAHARSDQHAAPPRRPGPLGRRCGAASRGRARRRGPGAGRAGRIRPARGRRGDVREGRPREPIRPGAQVLRPLRDAPRPGRVTI